MHTAVMLAAQLLAGAPAEPPPMIARPGVDWAALGAADDTARTRRRRGAIEYSDAYHTRLVIHRWLSFAMIPFFIGSYVTGDQILRKSTDAPDWARRLHAPFATGTAVLFTANTVTGLWNLWESRKDPEGRTKRIIHGLLFIAADAGFAWTGTQLADQAEESDAMRRKHRNVALASMGVSVVSWSMMLLFK